MNRLFAQSVSASVLEVSARNASVIPYGTGCRPTLSWSGTPRLGHSLSMIYAGPNSYSEVHGVASIDRPVLLLGASDQCSGTTPLPALLPISLTNGQPGCFLLHSTELVTLMRFQAPLPPMKFGSQVTLPIPNEVGLLGLPFFAQWMTWHRHRSSIYVPWVEWIHLSDAVHVTVGA